MRPWRTLSLAGVLALALPALAAEVGKPAPAYTMRDENGKAHSLSEYRGRIVVLEWTNPECPFVQRHYGEKTMQKTLAALSDKQVVWLAVDSTSHNVPESSRAWKARNGFSYSVLQDASGAVGHAFGAKTTPGMFVIDEKGVLRYSGAIDDDPRGKSSTPTNYVKQAVNAVASGQPVSPSVTESYGCTVKYDKSS